MKNTYTLKQWVFILVASCSSLFLSAQNIALNKPATASSVENSTLTADKAVDGNGTTRWANAIPWTTPGWIYVDLGASYVINRVELNWETAYANGYQIQVSNNASAWTTIFTTSTGNGGTDNLTGLSGTGRYVRMYATSRGTSYGFSLFEFKVYGTAVPPSGISLTVNKSSLKQTIEGFGFFGGRDNWWSSNDPSYFYTDAWLNLILGDLGITMWRNEIYPHNPPNLNNTANQDAHWDKQRPLVQALKAKAVSLGVDLKVLLTVWTPPGAFKWQSSFTWAGDPNATRGPTAQGDFYSEKNGGTLNPNKHAAFATWLTQAVQMYKDAGVTPYAISPQNEPAFSEPYNSCTYTTYWYRDMIKGVIPQVKAAHPGLKVFGSENMLELEGKDINYPYFYHTTLKNDATAMGLIDRISVHGYSNGVNPSSGSALASYWTRHKNEFSTPFNKPEWMTETSGYVDTWEASEGKPGAFNLALDMHAALYYGDLAGWLWWSGSGDPGSTSAIGEFQLMHGTVVGKKYNASKQFYRYIRPGARRMETSSPDSNLFITGYYHAANNTHTIVILNAASSSKTISISGSNLPASYDMYVTSSSQNNQLTTNVSATGITLPARSVVTLQAGGTPLGGTFTGKSMTPAVTPADKEEVKSTTVFLYPNPLRSGDLTVGIYADKKQEAVVTLLNATSQPVLEMKRTLVKGYNSFTVPVQSTSNGVYFLKVRQGNVQTMKKLILQKE